MQRFFGKLKKRKPVLLRQIVGKSMHPHFREGRIIVASGWFKQLKPRDVVIIAHDGMEKIKRIERFRGYEKREIFVRGDNPDQSTDSRDFGWLPADSIRAKILWPRT